uniref:Uncharacterized protein n=1 Tax=Setaria italica TaxID=4555 RepID=K3ZFM1_SETIT
MSRNGFRTNPAKPNVYHLLYCLMSITYYTATSRDLEGKQQETCIISN